MQSSVVVLVLLVLLCDSLEPVQGKRIPRWWMKIAQKQGPNACVVEEVPNTGLEFWTECKYWLNRRICGRKTRIRFECCEGFEQIEGEKGCARVKPLVNILETAESLGATDWAQYIRESGLANELESAGPFTLFAPTNEAFNKLRRSLKSQLESYRGNPNNPILLYHLIPTKLKSDEFEGNTMMETKHQGHSVRINKYSNGMTTINCALLLRKDQAATNGVVHIIDSLLDPTVGVSQNVADMVLNDGRFTILAEMLEKSGYINVLRTMQEPITMLAPSDEAFQKLKDTRREKIINDREARLALLQNHVMPHVICESAITGEHRVRTTGNNKITFNCDISGAYVESSKLRGNFNLGKNGIVHMIDDVLLPDRAKNLLELAESRQLVTFVDLVKRAGLEETLTHTGDYTFFVPDENAWLAVDDNALKKAKRDLEYAGLLIRYHGAYGRHLTNGITDNQAIMSLDEENPLRLQVWRRALGVEDAKITEKDLEAQNGVIHIINKVMFPSNQSVPQVLRNIKGDRFRIFMESMQRVEAMSPPLLNLGPGDDYFYTFFVPTDKAFDQLSKEQKREMRTDDFMAGLIRSHVAMNMFPEMSFEDGLLYSITGMDGDFDVRRTDDGTLIINDEIVKSSHMSANGVIHVIEKVFIPSSGYTYSTHKSISTVSGGYRGGGSSTSGDSYGNSYSSSGSSSRSSHTSSGRTSYRRTYSSNTGLTENLDENSFGGDMLPIPEGSPEPDHLKVQDSNQGFRYHESSTINEDTSRLDDSYFSDPNIQSPDTHTLTNNLDSNDQYNYEYRNNNGVYKSFNPPSHRHNTTRSSGTVVISRESYTDGYNTNDDKVNVNTVKHVNPSYQHTRHDEHRNKITKIGSTIPIRHSGSSSRSYSVSRSRKIPAIRLDKSNNLEFNKVIVEDDTLGRDKSFNYQGHPYGQDVVGHIQRTGNSSALPLTQPKPLYVHSTNRTKVTSNTIPAIRISKHKYFSNYINTTQPPMRHYKKFMKNKRNVLKNRKHNKPKNFSAYAFTGDSEFADGAEFVETIAAPESYVSRKRKRSGRKNLKKKSSHRHRHSID